MTGLGDIRGRLEAAVASDGPDTFADLFRELDAWCHEGCTLDATSVGVCSHFEGHDGTVAGATQTLRDVARSVIKDIDAGWEGC